MNDQWFVIPAALALRQARRIDPFDVDERWTALIEETETFLHGQDPMGLGMGERIRTGER